MKTIYSLILCLALVALSSSLRVDDSHLDYDMYKVQSSTLDSSITKDIRFTILKGLFIFKGCNYNRARTYEDQDSIQFGEWVASRRYCDEDHDFEIINLLNQASSFKQDDTTYKLFNQKGDQLAKFVKL